MAWYRSAPCRTAEEQYTAVVRERRRGDTSVPDGSHVVGSRARAPRGEGGQGSVRRPESRRARHRTLRVSPIFYFLRWTRASGVVVRALGRNLRDGRG